MRLRPKSLAILCAAAFVPALALRAQEPGTTAKRAAVAKENAKAQTTATKQAPQAEATKPSDVQRIIDEGMKRSQVMATLSYLTDVIGPRLTGSPGLKRANEWTRDKLAGWGLEHSHLEAWGPFGRGWTLKGFSVQVVEPQCIPLIAYPKAWSPGTDGKVTGEVVYLDVKTDADFAKYKGKLKGKIVLMTPPAPVPAHFEPQGVRMGDKELLALADAPTPGAGGQRPRRPQPPATPATPAQAAASETTAPQAARMAEFMAQAAVARKKLTFCLDEGVAAVLDVSRTGDGGTILVSAASVPGPAPAPGAGGGGARMGGPSAYAKDAPKNLPQITVAKEHYNRLVRMIEQGEALKIALDLAVEFQDKDLMSYNTVAEIPGTDLKDEVVMLGGHLDSWHSGTGATDNAAGCAVGMEAVRLIKALDIKPRRTIRIALWTGEEEGLLGSRAYVKEHLGEGPSRGMNFGGPPAPGPTTLVKKPEYDKFSAYFNLDNGTGKVRGVYLQGNEAVRPIFREWLAPFRDLGAATLSISNTGGTDHLSFDGIGLPGFQFIQDEIEYDTRTHHSNQDVYDRIQAEDMKQAAVIMASFVLQTANRDEKLPRKPSPAPAPPPSPTPTPTPATTPAATSASQ
jgi:carboxypeptidase Q